MRHRLVLRALGNLVLMVCVGMLLCIGVSAAMGGTSHDRLGLLGAAVITFIGGCCLRYLPRRGEEHRFGSREAFAVVTFGWISCALFGSLPFTLSGAIPSFTDAFFETISGFTTTGASILTDIEGLRKPYPGILFWRSLTHWYGGMGIVVLSVAILPSLKAGGFQLFTAEMSGVKGEKLTPRIAESAKLLWWVYFMLTALEIGLLFLGGMPLYDSFCHTFGTVATGGFSTQNASIGAYGSYVQWVITIFMLIAGINFILHFKFVTTGSLGGYFRDGEFRLYAIVVILAILATTVLQVSTGGWGTLGVAFRESSFTVAAISTTTGYAVPDFDLWPAMARILLLALMVMGGCAGSTAGGLKVVRIFMVAKYAWRELKRLVRPHSVITLRLGKQTVEESAMAGILGILVLYVICFTIACVLMATIMGGVVPATYQPTETAVTSVIAALGNIGPGLGAVGPTQNYAWVPTSGKWLLCFCMLLGRLEFYSVLILLVPLTWRR